MRILRSTILLAGLVPALLLAGCSSNNKDGKGTLYIESCSLGCNDGQGGQRVFCDIIQTHQNVEISILFSLPIDMASVNASSFRVVDVSNGTSPVGTFVLDPANSRRLIYRPSLTFDILGNPEFGLDPNTSYQIVIPGREQGDNPPFLQSTSGAKNDTRLQCTILTSEGVADLVPGPPTAEIYVDVVTGTDADGNPTEFDRAVVAGGQVNVWRHSPITIIFRDIMNPATLPNPATGDSAFIRVMVDADGSLGTEADRVTIAGTYEVVRLSLEDLVTEIKFTPTQGYPSAGTIGRKIVVDIPEQVIDLAGNSVPPESGGGETSFTPEVVQFESITLPGGGEDFTDDLLADSLRSSGLWGGGRLARDVGGGSGRVGELHVLPGQTVILNTDSQEFPLQEGLIDILGNPDIDGDFPETLTITDGAFEFNRVQVDAGGTLIFEGSNAARLFSRGRMWIQGGGQIIVDGSSAPLAYSGVARPDDDGTCTDPQYLYREPCESAGETWVVTAVAPAGGPGAGTGGYGADRYDAAGTGLISLPGIPALVIPGADIEGRGGEGVGGTGTSGQGIGGQAHPPLSADWPKPSGAFTDDNLGDVSFSNGCGVRQVAQSGSGGAYSMDGEAGLSGSDFDLSTEPSGLNNASGPNAGGDADQLNLATPDVDNTDYVHRLLNFENGFLLGGSGGGGGGAHPFGAYALAALADCIGGFATFNDWYDHSGASGGGGGGAIQAVSGVEITLDGQILARGGEGGSAVTILDDPDLEPVDNGRSAPGGGGSGGAVKLQSLLVTIAPVTDRIDVSGGMGGTTTLKIEDDVALGRWDAAAGAADSPGHTGDGFNVGGAGGAGLVRIEDRSSLYATNLEMNLDLAPYITPHLTGADTAFGPGESLELLSVAANGWATPRTQPESFTASVSCWIRPQGNFFSLNLRDDVEGSTDPDEMGWNMDVIWFTGGSEVVLPYRGQNTLFGNSFEEEFGNMINHADDAGAATSPVAVRFQGVRLQGDPDDLCDVSLNSALVAPGSVTPWVDHPSKLNDWPIVPNAIRFCIVFDTSINASLVVSMRGVTNLWIAADPD